MADPVNLDVQRAFSLIGGPLSIVDDGWALVANSQASGLIARGQMFVVTQSVNQGSVLLPTAALASALMVIFNESANTIRIGCANPNDTINLTATTPNFSAGFISLVTKNSAVCVASQSPFGKRGGPTASPNNWHVTAFQG